MKKEILIIENLAAFENVVNRDQRPYDINMMVMPGTLEDKHKDIDPAKGIQALRRKFNLVYILTGGVHDVHLGADYRWLNPNDLVIVPENFLYASSHVSQCKGYCIHFKTEFIQPLLTGSLAEDFPFFDLEADHIVNVTEEESKRIQEGFKNIISEYERFSPEKDYILRNYIHILLLMMREIYRPHAKKLNESATRSMKITNQFKHLLEKHFIEWREVKQYAAHLHITPKYLSEAVKATIGKTPKDLINDVLLLESKVLLGSTGKTITEIAHELCFQDQAHFSRFFRQHTGNTPTDFRKKV
ncbi:MAG TPA: helix-turn-helix domain-containing protein [Saprospiraceae bacterium]|nr:helix-turn-helix domain-containing protein [Saprospiraceae bacterium]